MKKRSRSIPVLDDKQKRLFIELCARNAPIGEFLTKLNLGQIDIVMLRASMNIGSDELAKAAWEKILEFDKLLENDRQIARDEAKRKHSEAEQRLQNSLDEQVAQDTKRIIKHNATISKKAQKIKKEDAARQKRFEKSSKTPPKSGVAGYIVPSKYYTDPGPGTVKSVNKWKIPPEITGDEFKHLLSNKGIRFVCTQFGITVNDIMRELARLKISLNIDLLPR